MRRPLLFFVSLVACAAPPKASPKPAGGLVQVIATTPSPKNEAKPAEKPPPRADATLLPRSVLFSNPDRASPHLSADGKHISYLSSVDGVLNVWVAATGDLANALPVTKEKKRGIRFYRWAFDNQHILYSQDEGGDENWHVHAVDVKSGKDQDLTPYAGVQARIERTSYKMPHEILVGMNDRDKRYHDLYRVDILTGTRTLLLENNGYSRIDADENFKVRFITKPEKDGSLTIEQPDKKSSFQQFFADGGQ